MFPTMRGFRWALLGVALLSSMGKDASEGHAGDGTNMGATAESGLPESLEHAWATAIASARRLNEWREFSGTAGQSIFPIPGLKAERGIFWLDEGPSTLTPSQVSAEAPDELIWGGRVTATMPLFAVGRIGNDGDTGKTGWKSARAGDRQDILDLKLAVADAYVKVLRAVQTHAGRRDAEANFNRLLLRPLTNTVRLEPLPPPPEAGDLDQLTARAFRERPELAALAEQARVLRRESRDVRISALPTIGLSAGYNHFESSSPRDQVWTLGIVGSWNNFDSFHTRDKARALKVKADAISALRAQTMDGVSRQVRHAWLEATNTLRELQVSRDALTRANENLKAAGSNSESPDAEATRGLCIDKEERAVNDAAIANFRLRRAVGDL
jgi:outer membrane protein TolC